MTRRNKKISEFKFVRDGDSFRIICRLCKTKARAERMGRDVRLFCNSCEAEEIVSLYRYQKLAWKVTQDGPKPQAATLKTPMPNVALRTKQDNTFQLPKVEVGSNSEIDVIQDSGFSTVAAPRAANLSVRAVKNPFQERAPQGDDPCPWVAEDPRMKAFLKKHGLRRASE